MQHCDHAHPLVLEVFDPDTHGGVVRGPDGEGDACQDHGHDQELELLTFQDFRHRARALRFRQLVEPCRLVVQHHPHSLEPVGDGRHLCVGERHGECVRRVCEAVTAQARPRKLASGELNLHRGS